MATSPKSAAAAAASKRARSRSPASSNSEDNEVVYVRNRGTQTEPMGVSMATQSDLTAVVTPTGMAARVARLPDVLQRIVQDLAHKDSVRRWLGAACRPMMGPARKVSLAYVEADEDDDLDAKDTFMWCMLGQDLDVCCLIPDFTLIDEACPLCVHPYFPFVDAAIALRDHPLHDDGIWRPTVARVDVADDICPVGFCAGCDELLDPHVAYPVTAELEEAYHADAFTQGAWMRKHWPVELGLGYVRNADNTDLEPDATVCLDCVRTHGSIGTLVDMLHITPKASGTGWYRLRTLTAARMESLL